MKKESAKEIISKHIAPAEVVGDVGKFGDKWRALVTIRPSGPLLLMEFRLTQRAPDRLWRGWAVRFGYWLGHLGRRFIHYGGG